MCSSSPTLSPEDAPLSGPQRLTLTPALSWHRTPLASVAGANEATCHKVPLDHMFSRLLEISGMSFM